MLLNCHKLDAVVAALFDVRKDVVGKLAILGYTPVLRAHAHMCFINFQVPWHGANARILELVVRLEMHSIK